MPGRSDRPEEENGREVVTLRTLAARAGVSVAVVSGVINDSPYVRMSAKTRQRVLDEIKRADYVPNQAARSLRLKRSQTIAVVLPALHNPIFLTAMEGIYAEADRNGYVILLGEAQHLASGSRLLDRVLARGGADGLLIRMPQLLESSIDRLTAAGTPMLALEPAAGGAIPSVSIDEARGIEVATEHLLQRGHRRIGFFGGDPAYRGTQVRVEAFRNRMSIEGIAIEHEVCLAPQDPIAAYEPAARFIRDQPELTAIVCNNVITAMAISAAAQDLGLQVPNDLSLLAFHDVPEASVVRPAITAVRMPMRELGAESVRGLLTLIESGTFRDTVIGVEPVLIERDSVGEPRTRSHLSSRASRVLY